MSGYFVTGTDTGVGKTTFCALLIRAMRAAGVDAVGMKPLACGETNDDTDALVAASDRVVTAEEINPVWLRPAAAPFTASVIEKRIIDTEFVLTSWRSLQARFGTVIVEGAGGWLVPIRADYLVADLAVEMGLPVLLVVDNKLGALNHTLLTLESIQRRGLTCRGIVLNHRVAAADVAAQTNRAVLETLTPVPILFELQPEQSALDPAPLLADGAA